MTTLAPPTVPRPRCGAAIEVGEVCDVDCDHCGGCWQVGLIVRGLWRWYLAAAVAVVVSSLRTM
jgi:hypothetical protein